nr:hypothetical transcript [Hymenolepis microstoma]
MWDGIEERRYRFWKRKLSFSQQHQRYSQFSLKSFGEWRRILRYKIGPIIALLVLVLGLDRIFDVSLSSSGSSSPIGLNPNVFVEDNRFIESLKVQSRQLDGFSLNLIGIKTPKCIGGVVEVTSLTESSSEESILTAEERCDLVPAPGLGRIFDVSSLKSSGASSCSGEEFDLDLGPILKSSKRPDRIHLFEVVDLDFPASTEAISSTKEGRERTGWLLLVCSSESSTPTSSREEDLNIYADSEVSLYSPEKPESVVVVKVKDPGSLASMEAVLVAEGKRVANQWLVVYVEGSTTSILLPPRIASTEKSFSRSGFTSCLEWLECVGMSQVIIAVPSGDGESMCKSLLFLGFSMLPKDVIAEQLPSWLGGYILLITDFIFGNALH